MALGEFIRHRVAAAAARETEFAETAAAASSRLSRAAAALAG